VRFDESVCFLVRDQRDIRFGSTRGSVRSSAVRLFVPRSWGCLRVVVVGIFAGGHLLSHFGPRRLLWGLGSLIKLLRNKLPY
jgi:hypothetical protein